MKILDRLQQRFGRYALRNLTLMLICGQLLTYSFQFTHPTLLKSLALVPQRVLEGEWWRVFTFVFEPPLTNPVFAFFFWYMFYLMGTALERVWGDFRYNMFLLIGYSATVAASFVTPEQETWAVFMQGSVFLAFAHLYPDFTIMLFFLLPVKIKWLALLAWIKYFLTIVGGAWPERLMAAAAVCNFLIFFGREILQTAGMRRRRMAERAKSIGTQQTPLVFHRCRICGATEKSHPDLDFRYCSKCAGGCCYCPEHLRNHEHVTTDEPEAVAEG